MAATAGGIRAGAAYVELFVKDNKLTRGLAQASAKLKAFGAGITGIGTQLFGLGAALATPFALATKLFTDMGSDLDDMSQRTGVSIEALSELGFAAQQSGTDIETLEGGLQKMAKFVVSAADGSQQAADTLARLGVNIEQLKTMAPDDQFAALAEGLSKIENPTQKAALAMELFGKSGTKLLPMLNDGAEGIEKLRQQARDLGLTVSTADAQSAAEFGDQLDTLGAVLKRGAFAIGAALVPELKELVQWIIRTTADVVAWINQNRGLIVSVAKIIAIVAGVGAALIAVGATISAAGAAIGGLVAVFSALGTVIGVIGSVLGAIATPVGLVIVSLVALGAVFATCTDAGRTMTSEVMAGFESMAATAKTAWGGIVAAVQAGDLELAFKIVLAAINLEWSKFTLWLQEKWVSFKNFFVDSFFDGVAALKLMFWDFTAWLTRTFAGAIEKMFQAAAWVAEKVGLDDLAKNLRENFDFSEENINRNRDRIKQQIIDDRIKAKEEAHKFRDGQLAEAKDKVAQATQELQDLVKEAEQKRDAAQQRQAPKVQQRSYPYDDMVDLAKKVVVRGTFNPLAVRGMGSDSANARVAKAVDQINGNVAALVNEARHGGLVFA